LSTIGCTGPSGFKECAVEFKWDKPISFNLFGLSLPIESIEIADTKYGIFLRKLDNSGWVKETNDKNIALYHSKKYNDYGFIVRDKSCFERLVTILNSLARKEVVELTDTKEKVTIIGEISLSNKMLKF
jgi:hypothetical protein